MQTYSTGYLQTQFKILRIIQTNLETDKVKEMYGAYNTNTKF